MERRKWHTEKSLSEESKKRLNTNFDDKINDIKNISFYKALNVVKVIPRLCKLHFESLENRKIKQNSSNKYHPVRPERGEIYNAEITENVGSELNGNHLVVIMQNKNGNIYGEKVNVLPIEGNGTKVNPNYQYKLTNNDLENGDLHKDPSRIIITDITTLDKARLGYKIGKIKQENMVEISTLLKRQLEI